MVRIINSGEPKAVSAKMYYGGLEDYNPSLETEDIRLSPGWYLLEGSRVGTREDFEGTSKEGIIIRIKKKDLRIPNLARVVKLAKEGCVRAGVGDYVMLPPYGGNLHDHLKALPLHREIDDKLDLWILHEDFVFAVISPAEEAEEEE